jgi:hypothetical protein
MFASSRPALDELRQQQDQGRQDRREAALSERLVSIHVLLRRKPKHPLDEIKLLICDPSNHRIKHVNIKTVAFR